MRRLILCLLLLLPLPAALRADPVAPLNVAVRTELNRRIARAGNAATVGIYCSRGEHEHYFGTGAIISPDGYILTSTTVVPDGSKDIQIFLTNHTRLDAVIQEVNEGLESTLLKVEAKDLPFLPVADKMPAVGEKAYSFGNANNMIRLGESASFSVGIVSGVYSVKSADSQSTYEGLAIETNAAINPGQDGGPLLNCSGQLAGIISLSYSDARWQGMAVPVTLLRKGLKALTDGSVKLESSEVVRAPGEDKAEGNPLVGHARTISKALVQITVKRKWDPAVLPRLFYPEYINSIEGYSQKSELEQRRLQMEFTLSEKTLEANRQIRRPLAPVTGLLISADGLILTSIFNLKADNAYVHKKEGIRPVSYEGSVRKLTAFSPKDYRRASNEVESVEVCLPDGKTAEAKILARHPALGVALLKVEGADLPFVDLAAQAGTPTLGEAVGVLGIASGDHPFTLNTGIVSATYRNNDLRFQFDASINYGNSGGPIVNGAGHILGFAANPMVPSPMLGRVLPQQELQKWMIALNGGVSMGARTDKILKALPELEAGKTITGLKGPFIGVTPQQSKLLTNLVVIDRVMPGSPADKAGIRRGDRVVSFDGKPLNSWKSLTQAVRARKGGDTVSVVIERKQPDRYLSINGQAVRTTKDLEELFHTLKSGEAVNGDYTESKTREVKLTIGERK